jgi:dienelactone hydrolase
MERVKKRSIARSIVLAVCCSLVASPVWAKTFIGVLYPFLGPMAALGLVDMASELKAQPDVEVATYQHQSWRSLVDHINRQPKGTRILIVGYSLGANNAILVANNVAYVDSIVALQPSMLTSKDSLTGTVGKIIEIYNPNPWMTFGGMGSRKLEAPNIEYVANNDSHPGAQFNTEFRNIVRNEVARLAALDAVKTAPVKMAQSSRAIKQAKTETKTETKTSERAQAKVAKQERAERQPKVQAQASAFPDPILTSLKSDTARQDPPERQLRALAAFPEPPSSSAKADTLLVQRTLTIADMKEFVKRNYPNSPTADLTR